MFELFLSIYGCFALIFAILSYFYFFKDGEHVVEIDNRYKIFICIILGILWPVTIMDFINRHNNEK